MSKKKQRRFAVHNITGIWKLVETGSTPQWAAIADLKIVVDRQLWLVQTFQSTHREFTVKSVAMVPGYTNRLTVYGTTMYLGMANTEAEVWLYPDGRRYLAFDRFRSVSLGQILAAQENLRLRGDNRWLGSHR
jgi:hypothetical protein